jgi:hypothetical protein
MFSNQDVHEPWLERERSQVTFFYFCDILKINTLHKSALAVPKL